MLRIIKKHPLIAQMVGLSIISIMVVVAFFYPGYRERHAIAQFQANHPGYDVDFRTTNDAPEWMTKCFDSLGITNYYDRIKMLSLKTAATSAASQTDADVDLSFLATCDRTIRLRLIDLKLDPEELKTVNQLKSLKTIIVHNCHIQEEGTLTLHDLPDLEEFNSHRFLVQRLELSNLPQLKFLALNHSGIDDQVFTTLPEVADSLTELELSNCEITDKGLKTLHRLPNLEKINLRYSRSTTTGYPPFTVNGIIGLKDHPSLQGVDVSFTFDVMQFARLEQKVPELVGPILSPSTVRPQVRESRTLGNNQ